MQVFGKDDELLCAFRLVKASECYRAACLYTRDFVGDNFNVFGQSDFYCSKEEGKSMVFYSNS